MRIRDRDPGAKHRRKQLAIMDFIVMAVVARGTVAILSEQWNLSKARLGLGCN
jgi:hypothetical protein